MTTSLIEEAIICHQQFISNSNPGKSYCFGRQGKEQNNLTQYERLNTIKETNNSLIDSEKEKEPLYVSESLMHQETENKILPINEENISIDQFINFDELNVRLFE